MSAGAGAAAAAAAAAEMQRQEEEEMTPYSPRDLAEDWEFKILRSNFATFRNPAKLRAVLDEEQRGGWVLVEKFDDRRIRLKRPAGTKAIQGDFADRYDPYRTTVGMSQGVLAATLLGFAALVMIGLLALLALAGIEGARPPFIPSPAPGTMGPTRREPMPGRSRCPRNAVAVLRFRIKGYRMPVRDRDLGAYRELVDAGIMEPVPGPEGEHRFTLAWGTRNPGAGGGADKERERYAPPDGDLSESAKERPRQHLAGDRRVTEQNHPAYRELVAARVMIHSRPFVGGDDYRLTYWGWKLKDELIGCADGNSMTGCVEVAATLAVWCIDASLGIISTV